jgi:hypothetical protein
VTVLETVPTLTYTETAVLNCVWTPAPTLQYNCDSEVHFDRSASVLPVRSFGDTNQFENALPVTDIDIEPVQGTFILMPEKEAPE